MSIIRIGLAQTRNFGDGYDAIFGKQKTAAAKKGAKTVKASAKKSGAKKAKKKKK